MARDPAPILPYADASLPPGVDELQIFRAGHDLRRVIVPTGVSLEVTPFAFRLAVAGPFGTRRSTWPRSALTEAHVNAFNHRLVLRIEGQDRLELDVGPNAAFAERVMHEVIASMTVIPVAPRHLQTVADSPDDSLPPSPLRTVLLRSSAALFAAALLCLALVPIASFYLTFASIACVGIAFGTQRKDYWA